MKTINLYLKSMILLAAIVASASSVFAGTIRYVKTTATGTGDGSSWTNASGDLQAMLSASTDGDSVWVTAGTYFPASLPPGTTTVTTTSRDFAFYVPAGVNLYGGFAGNEVYISDRNLALNITILDGDIGIAGDINDNCHHVLIFATSTALNNPSRADAITIKNGNANGSGNIVVAGRNYARNNGGGIISILCIKLDLYNMKLTDNRSSGRGGAAFLASLSMLNLNNSLISGNIAAAGNNDGGGLYLNSCSGTVWGNTFSNNQVSGVVAGNGAGLFLITGTLNILNNSFYNNNCSRSGGGICISAGTVKISNNVLYNNQAANTGGGIALLNAPDDTVANNTFYANAATNGGGGISITTKSYMHNNIFRDNLYNGNTTIPGADYYRPTAAANAVIARNNFFQLAQVNYTQTGTGNTDIGTTAANNIFQLDPLFTNSSLPAGTDGIDRTADDGLIPLACSPAVNSGDQTLLPAGVTTDIINAARTQQGATDMGAYERSSITPDASSAITTTALTVTKTQTGTVVYANDCNTLIATLTSSGASPVSGSTTSRVWLETVQPARFVKRHYEITPAANAGTATGRVTLYFTQQEFDDFNAVNSIKLPEDPADGPNYKTNLLIEKRAGNSSDGSGLPASYAGTVSLIDPVDTDIIWNATQNRWEVSFDVDGFSGLFVKSTPLPLAVKWVSFSGSVNASKQAVLTWKVEELNVIKYEVEKSVDATNFSRAATVSSQGDGTHTYSYTEAIPLQQDAYYRIKQSSADGKVSYSNIIKLNINRVATISVYPNPVKNTLQIASAMKQSAIVLDASGKTVLLLTLPSGIVSIHTGHWGKGLYILKAEDGETVKLLKE